MKKEIKEKKNKSQLYNGFYLSPFYIEKEKK
jgi:hypothetical protein